MLSDVKHSDQTSQRLMKANISCTLQVTNTISSLHPEIRRNFIWYGHVCCWWFNWNATVDMNMRGQWSESKLLYFDNISNKNRILAFMLYKLEATFLILNHNYRIKTYHSCILRMVIKKTDWIELLKSVLLICFSLESCAAISFHLIQFDIQYNITKISLLSESHKPMVFALQLIMNQY